MDIWEPSQVLEEQSQIIVWEGVINNSQQYHMNLGARDRALKKYRLCKLYNTITLKYSIITKVD